MQTLQDAPIMCVKKQLYTYSCCLQSRPWGKLAAREAANSAAGACGSRCRSARLSGCAAWRCWWNSRWHRSPGIPLGIQCWGVGTKRRHIKKKMHLFLLPSKCREYLEHKTFFRRLLELSEPHQHSEGEEGFYPRLQISFTSRRAEYNFTDDQLY